jgi:hypothetical protein
MPQPEHFTTDVLTTQVRAADGHTQPGSGVPGDPSGVLGMAILAGPGLPATTRARATAIAAEALSSRTPRGLVTSLAAEVVRAGGRRGVVTNLAVEALRSAADQGELSAAVTDAVAVATDLAATRDRAAAVTTALAVATDLISPGPRPVAVTTAVAVATALSRTSGLTGILGTNDSRGGTLYPGAVGSARPDFVPGGRPVSLATTVIVAQDLLASGVGVPVAVVQEVSATQDLRARGTTRQAVAHAVAVDSEPAGRNTSVPVAVVQQVSAAEVPAAAPTFRLAVTDPLAIAQAIDGRNVVVRLAVTTPVAVDQVPSARNSVVRVGVTTSIGVGTPASGRDDVDRLSVTDTVTASGVALGHPNRIRAVASDSVSVSDRTAATTNPLRMSVGHLIAVAGTLIGGNGQRPLSYLDAITVASVADPKRPQQSVLDHLTVAEGAGGGGGHRDIAATSAIVIVDAVAGRSTGAHKTVIDRVTVSHVRSARGPDVPLSVTDTVAVGPTPRGAGPKRTAAADAVVVLPAIDARRTAPRVAVADAIAVSDRTHPNLLSAAVTTAVTVGWRLATLELDVITRVRVDTKHIRLVEERVADALVVDDARDKQAIFNRRVVDLPAPAEAVARGATLIRPVVQTLAIPDATFKKRIWLPDPIWVPVAAGGLVTNYIVIQSSAGAIVLPAPQLGDGTDNVDSVTVHRSMNGRAMVYRQSSTRRTLKLRFRIDKAKALELRTFLQAHLSEPLKVTMHDARQWIVVIPQAPVELQFAGRGAPASGGASSAAEFATWEVTMEGQPIT